MTRGRNDGETPTGLEPTEPLLRAITTSVADALYVVDQDERILYTNPAGLSILGYPDYNELLGRVSHDTIHFKHPDGSPFPAEDCPLLEPKRGGGMVQVSLHEGALVTPGTDLDIVMLDSALTALAAMDPRKAEIVEMRFFGGLSVEEIAEVLRVSAITVKRDWRAAKLWLYRELTGGGDAPREMAED